VTSCPYGWCGYCPAFTYHDLTGGPSGTGACGDCVARWRQFPAAAPRWFTDLEARRGA
jgi:hypothetical protein